ncbi:anthrone oxygenase family protein [Pseudonocardia nematodicida]|uniref:Anthrone oxygenase family protein n=1 Tax=Pseudonocardia nematodicida TaxID=1206997 RepID=A0ABV1KC57_9PSEU
MISAAAALGSGLLGGVYLAFSVAVLPALRRRPAQEAVATMREVNRVILNPVFGLLFFGTAVACLAVLVLAAVAGNPIGIAGALAGLAGFVVTGAVNVPGNVRLDRGAAWADFDRRWTPANHVRTGTSALAVALLLL